MIDYFLAQTICQFVKIVFEKSFLFANVFVILQLKNLSEKFISEVL